MTILTTSIVSPVIFEIRDAFYVSFLPFLFTFSHPPGSLRVEMNKKIYLNQYNVWPGGLKKSHTYT
jgi:hypothetical protein